MSTGFTRGLAEASGATRLLPILRGASARDCSRAGRCENDVDQRPCRATDDLAKSCWRWGRRRWPTWSCSRCCCAPACPARACSNWRNRCWQHCGGWSGLLRSDARALARIKGLGPAKRAELGAVLEIARRALSEQLAQALVFDNPAVVKQFVALAIGALELRGVRGAVPRQPAPVAEARERCSAARSPTPACTRARCARVRSSSTARRSSSRTTIRRARPSRRADEFLTQSLKSALQLVDVRVLDHLVVGRGEVASFAERGLL